MHYPTLSKKENYEKAVQRGERAHGVTVRKSANPVFSL